MQQRPLPDTLPAECAPPGATDHSTDERIEPWHLPHLTGRDILLIAPRTQPRCTNACRGLRAPCTCARNARPLLWYDIPEHWRTRMLAVALAAVVLAVSLGIILWSEIQAALDAAYRR